MFFQYVYHFVEVIMYNCGNQHYDWWSDLGVTVSNAFKLQHGNMR